MPKIDPITKYLLEGYDQNTIVEGYDLKCSECGKVITMVKDGSGPISCCNKRMFVMGSQEEPKDNDISNDLEDYEDDIDESAFIKSIRGTFSERRSGPQGIKKALKGEVVAPDFQVPYKSVHFTPDNQAEVQKQREKEREVNESLKSADPTDKEREDIEKSLMNILGGVVSSKPESAEFTPYNQPETQKKQREKMNEASTTFSPEDVKKARDIYNTKSGYRKHREEEREKKYGASTIKGFLKLFKKEELERVAAVIASRNKISEAGFEHKPKGWTDKSVKKFGNTLVKGGGKKKGFFDKCVKRMQGKVKNPEGFCAAIKDESYGSTYWRGKGKTPQEAGKDIKKHKNV